MGLKSLLFIVFLLLTVFYTLSTTYAHNQTVIIEMTADGFNPQEAALDTNSTVIFINKDSKAHWPASDVHPTHGLYPEFDPQKPITPGESWTFKAKRTGIWKFHDHLYPHFKGILIVNPEAGKTIDSNELNLLDGFKELMVNVWNSLKQVFKLNKNLPIPSKDEFNKLSANEQFKTLEDLASSQGAEKAWQFVRDTYVGQSGSSGNIHDLAHLSGNLLFEKLKFAGLEKCSVDFAFGCYHGFLDKAFAKSLDKLQEAEDACGKVGSKLSGPPKASLAISGPVASCIHGIGHGVASFYSVSDLNKSLSTCRKLISGSEYCFDGVFMEFARSAPNSFYNLQDPLYPCDSLERDFGYIYSSACGRNQPALLMGRFNMGFAQVAGICLNSDSPPFKQSCFDALGFSVASSGNVEQIIAGCQSIKNEQFVNSCTKAAAGELVFQEVPNWQQKSKIICNSLVDNRECLSYIERLISDYGRK